jgi:hypothetical protein
VVSTAAWARGAAATPDVLRQGEAVDPEDVVRGQPAPEPGEPLDADRERVDLRREEGGVDGAGRDAGQDRNLDVRVAARQPAQHADLVGGARSAPAHDQGKLRAGAGAHAGESIRRWRFDTFPRRVLDSAFRFACSELATAVVRPRGRMDRAPDARRLDKGHRAASLETT